MKFCPNCLLAQANGFARLSLQAEGESLGMRSLLRSVHRASRGSAPANLAAITRTPIVRSLTTLTGRAKNGGRGVHHRQAGLRPPLLEEHLRELQSYYSRFPPTRPALSAPLVSNADEQASWTRELHQVAEATPAGDPDPTA